MVKIQLDNINKIKTAYIERIDEAHANPQAEWIEMGRPSSLSLREVHILEMISSLVRQPFPVMFENNSAFLELDIPAQGVACITLEL